MGLINKFVIKNMKLNKKRSIVTVIGIILSVALLVALFTLVSSFQKSLVEFEKAKNGDYHIRLEGLNEKEIEEVLRHRDIESYYTMNCLGYAKLEGIKNEDKPYLCIVGTDEKGFEKAGFELVKGRMPENENEIIIPRHLKTNGRVELNIGDKLSLEIGKRVSLDENWEFGQDIMLSRGTDEDRNNNEISEKILVSDKKEYTVVGLMERPSYVIEPYTAPGYTCLTKSNPTGEKNSGYFRLTKKGLKRPIDVVAEICGLDKDIANKVYGEGSYTSEEYEKIMGIVDNMPFEPEINKWLINYERIWPIDQALMAVVVLAAVVALIIILTSVYCIKNSFEISISEKIRQYGMLASIGATKKQIRNSVHLEAAYLGLIGIPVGTVSGLFAAYVLIKISNIILKSSLSVGLIFSTSWWGLLFAIVLGVVTIYFSAAKSARKAGKVSPMEAIRNQNEIKIDKRKIKTPKIISKIWGIGGVISYKNIKRNRKKYRTTTVSIVICVVTFIVTSYFMSMMFKVAGLHVNTDNASIIADVYKYDDFTQLSKSIRGIDNVDDYVIAQESDIWSANVEKTEGLIKMEKMSYDPSVALEDSRLLLCAMDDESFDAYVKENRLMTKTGEGIMINSGYIGFENEDGELQIGEGQQYTNKAGETIEFKDCNEKKYKLKLSDVTDARPMGLISLKHVGIVVVKYSDIKDIKDIAINQFAAYLDTDKDEQVQDDLETVLSGIECEYDINNCKQSVRQSQSLLILLGIFAYGLIAVIALIGITNIINTLGTSMQLRARDFATLRSVGMTSGQFNRMVRLETFFTGVKALIFGIVLGNIGAYLINGYNNIYGDKVVCPPPIKACLISIVVVMTLIYVIIKSSLNNINKRNIIETIKNENL